MALLRDKKIILLILVLGIFGLTFSQTQAQVNDSYVDILWEADSYTPPFYKGKALKVGPQSVKFVAMARVFDDSGRIISNSNLYYKWKLSGRVVGSVSGLGQESVVIGTSLRSSQVSVEIWSGDQETMYVEGSTLVKDSEPEILVYKNDPLMGVLFNKVLDDSVINEEEIKVTAFPYYFTTISSSGSNLDWTWRLNNNRVSSGVGISSLVFRKEGSGGRALFSVEVENIKNVFQDTKKSFIVNLSE